MLQIPSVLQVHSDLDRYAIESHHPSIVFPFHLLLADGSAGVSRDMSCPLYPMGTAGILTICEKSGE